ncbi:MAG: CRTAC1 family protein [Verrucomicrobiota bacterium]
MSQPLNRDARLPSLGAIDEEGGELWVDSPFLIPGSDENLSAYERNRLFLNSGGLKFIDASVYSGVDIDSDSRSVVAADFDRNGLPDLLIGSTGGGPLRLFRNVLKNDNRWVRIELIGTKSNRSAIGSRVTLRVGDREIVRDLFSANGFQGQAPGELLIGVGQADQIDLLKIRWPNGREEMVKRLPVNRTIEITESDR